MWARIGFGIWLKCFKSFWNSENSFKIFFIGVIITFLTLIWSTLWVLPSFLLTIETRALLAFKSRAQGSHRKRPPPVPSSTALSGAAEEKKAKTDFRFSRFFFSGGKEKTGRPQRKREKASSKGPRVAEKGEKSREFFANGRRQECTQERESLLEMLSVQCLRKWLEEERLFGNETKITREDKKLISVF